MRSKLIITALCITSAVILLCVKRNGDNKAGDSFGYYLSLDATLASSESEIERTLHCFQGEYLKREIRVGNTRFLFYVKYPFRGYSIDGVYCYEQVNDKIDGHSYWLLRGYFPISRPRFSELLKNHPEFALVEKNPEVITYAARGDSVELQIFGVELFSIKSIEGVLKGGQ
jgi:hypothetical protein